MHARGKAASTLIELTRQSGTNSEGKSGLPDPSAQPPKCPECGSIQIWKDGLRGTRDGDVQRYLCRRCGYRFSGFQQNRVPQLQIKKYVTFQPFKKLHSRPDFAQIPICHSDSITKKALNDSSFSICEDVSPHNDPAKSTVGKTINAFASTIVNAEYALEKKAKNLVEVETRIEKRAAGATKPIAPEVKGKLVEFLWWLKKNGYRKSTIETKVKLLKILAKRGGNLFDPESVKLAIAKQQWCTKRKANAVDAYISFLKMKGGSWDPPKYKPVHKLPFIPQENEIDQLIAGCGKKTATLLQLLKETGMRIGEAANLEWVDIDFEKRLVRITPEKGSRPRILQTSRKLCLMLKDIRRLDKDRIFCRSVDTMRRTFQKQRRRIAYKTQNPRLLRIHFHTFRHWKATMYYHKARDILKVKEMLGHVNVNNTLVYLHLEKALFNLESDEFNVKTAKTVEEASKLLEVGFDYVCDLDDVKLFRKRK